MFNFLKRRSNIQQLFYHTDVHCHILPGVDHGSPDIETSLMLIEKEMEMGINKIVTTSHVTDGVAENSPETLRTAFEKLKAAVKAKGLQVELALSAEYRIDDLFLSQLENKELLPYPNDYLLVENSFQQELLGFDDLMFNLQLKGFSPILAHPERYSYYNHDRYRHLHDSGVLFQANVLSFTGYYGGRAYATAMWMLQNDLIDFLGSDIHNENHARLLAEFTSTKEYKKIEAKLKDRLLNDTAFI